MLRLIGNLTNVVADYTIGSVIVVFHIATAERLARGERRRLPAVAMH